jgi:hypothetical protein
MPVTVTKCHLCNNSRNDLFDQRKIGDPAVDYLIYTIDSFESTHKVAYCPHTIIQTLVKAGFNPVSSEAQGPPQSDLLHLCITVLAYPLTGTLLTSYMIPERMVTITRSWGMLFHHIVECLAPQRAWINLVY